MAAADPRPIVIKKVKKGHHGHHGGAWKIAYADFVTAMMAFFLLMWLLGSVDGGKLKGISEYFKSPLKTSLAGGSSIGESPIILKGGGQDLTAEDGLVKKILEERAAEAEERRKMKAAKEELERLIAANPTLSKFKNQLLIDLTTEGLRVQIVDEQSRPMFGLASAELQPYVLDILRELVRPLNDMPNRISLSGHTDAKPYAGGQKSFSNWELSTLRANSARRELAGSGLTPGKVIRVVGLADSVLLDVDNPVSPINRRISIILLNKKAEEAAANEGRLPSEPIDGDSRNSTPSGGSGAPSQPAASPT